MGDERSEGGLGERSLEGHSLEGHADEGGLGERSLEGHSLEGHADEPKTTEHKHKEHEKQRQVSGAQPPSAAARAASFPARAGSVRRRTTSGPR